MGYAEVDAAECTSGTAATFESARAVFLAAWAVFLSKRTKADFEERRQERDWTARKYAPWQRGEKVRRRCAQRGSQPRCASSSQAVIERQMAIPE